MSRLRKVLARVSLAAGLMAAAVGLLTVAPQEALAAGQCPSNYDDQMRYLGCKSPGAQCFQGATPSTCGNNFWNNACTCL